MTKHSLKRHLEAHNKIKNHFCNLCDAKYSRIDLLRRHMKEKHTDQQFLPCPECGKVFQKGGCMDNHRRSLLQSYKKNRISIEILRI